MTIVYESLRELIVTGAFAPGVRVSESDLADRLSVSRTPVREALQRLDGDGLVYCQGRGVRVRTLDDRELAEVYEARTALDAWAAGRVAGLNHAGEISPSRLRALSKLAVETNALTRAGDLGAATRRNRAFHQAVAQLAGNAVIVATLDRFWDQIIVSTRTGLHNPTRAKTADAEHRQLIRAIRDGDAARASAVAAEHAMATRTLVIKENE